MYTEVKVPQLPENITDVTVAALYVTENQEVEYDQNLVDIETDKVILEVLAPAAGTIEKLQITTNQHVASEQVIMLLRTAVDSEISNQSIDTQSKEPIKIDMVTAATSDDKKPGENIETIDLEKIIGNSLFDRRGIICGSFGFMIGLVIGAMLTAVVLP
jgi:2-oxoglutarate dehydrogenase E2 component (dihydrolipoamide succinyltransferase)